MQGDWASSNDGCFILLQAVSEEIEAHFELFHGGTATTQPSLFITIQYHQTGTASQTACDLAGLRKNEVAVPGILTRVLTTLSCLPTPAVCFLLPATS